MLFPALAIATASFGAAAEPSSDRWLPPRSSVVLLGGLSGDLESENNYRDQLQGWLDLLGALVPPPEQAFVLWENAWTVTPPTGLVVQMLNSSREEFLSLAKPLAGRTNALVVIALGHGGMQGRTPVFHVRGPRLSPVDFKTLAGATAGESRWLLFFRGSGRFAAELLAERRQIISSDLESSFQSDPIAGSLILKEARAKSDASFLALAGQLGRLTGAWYEERRLARTEEPVLWLPGVEPKRLVGAEKEIALAAPLPIEKPDADIAEKPSPEATVAEPPSLWKEIARVDPQRFPEADAVVLRRKVSFTLGTAPAIASEHEEFVQILTADGKHWGEFDVSYSPPEEELQFLDCEVLCPDGKLLRLDPEDIRESTEQVPGDDGTTRRKFFSLPGVVVGAVLRVRYRTEWKSYPMPHVSMTIPLAGEAPLVESSLQVTVPKGSPFHFVFDHMPAADPEIQQRTHGSAYFWNFKDVPGVIAESLAPPDQEPALLISTFPDWAAFAGWYGRISKRTDEITPEISAKAGELTRDATTDREKVRAVYDYVTALRYVATPLGVNSFRPHAAGGVFKNQFGDCKDKANLFNTMLHSLGFEARLVLVPRFSQAHDGVPGLAFNHAISGVKLGEEVLWLDTTDEECRFGMLPPGDPGRNVLIIDGQTTTLTPLPKPLPRDHGLHLRGRVRVELGGEPSVLSLEAVGRGIVDYDFRDSARELQSQARNLPLLEAQFRNVAGAFAMIRQSSSSPSKLDQDFTCRSEGTCVGMVLPAGASHRLRAPFWVPKEWDLALHARQSPLFLNHGYPLTLEEEMVFNVSAGATRKVAFNLPAPRQGAGGPLTWSVRWSQSREGPRAALRIELESGELSTKQSSRFQTAWRELLTALAQEATFSTTNGHE